MLRSFEDFLNENQYSAFEPAMGRVPSGPYNPLPDASSIADPLERLETNVILLLRQETESLVQLIYNRELHNSPYNMALRNQSLWQRFKSFMSRTFLGNDRAESTHELGFTDDQIINELVLLSEGPVNALMDTFSNHVRDLQLKVERQIRAQFNAYRKEIGYSPVAGPSPGSPTSTPSPGPTASSPSTPPFPPPPDADVKPVTPDSTAADEPSTPTPAPAGPSPAPQTSAPTKSKSKASTLPSKLPVQEINTTHYNIPVDVMVHGKRCDVIDLKYGASGELERLVFKFEKKEFEADLSDHQRQRYRIDRGPFEGPPDKVLEDYVDSLPAQGTDSAKEIDPSKIKDPTQSLPDEWKGNQNLRPEDFQDVEEEPDKGERAERLQGYTHRDLLSDEHKAQTILSDKFLKDNLRGYVAGLPDPKKASFYAFLLAGGPGLATALFNRNTDIMSTDGDDLGKLDWISNLQHDTAKKAAKTLQELESEGDTDEIEEIFSSYENFQRWISGLNESTIPEISRLFLEKLKK